MEDISFVQSFTMLIDALMTSIAEVFHATEEQMKAFISAFFNQLPEYLKNALLGAQKLQEV